VRAVSDEPVIHINRVVILEDAAHLYVLQGESFRQVFHTVRLHNLLVEYLPAKVHDGTIGLDGARMNIADGTFLLEKRHFDIGILAAFLGENLDPAIHILTNRTSRVVPVDFAKKNHRRRARSFGLGRHFQFIGRHRLKSHRPTYRHIEAGNCSQKRRQQQTTRQTETKHGAFTSSLFAAGIVGPEGFWRARQR
jgi:hypothetical protein